MKKLFLILLVSQISLAQSVSDYCFNKYIPNNVKTVTDFQLDMATTCINRIKAAQARQREIKETERLIQLIDQWEAQDRLQNMSEELGLE